MTGNPYLNLFWDNHLGDLSSHFNYLLERELLVDVTVAAVGGSIRAHRLILSASSEYFQEILSEQPPDPNSIINLDEVDFKDLKSLIRYIYKGKVNLSEKELPSFLEAAEVLKIKGLDHHRREFEKSKSNNNLGGTENDFNPFQPGPMPAADLGQYKPVTAQTARRNDQHLVTYRPIGHGIIKEEIEMEEDHDELFFVEQLTQEDESLALLNREAEDAPDIALPSTSSASDCANIIQQPRSPKRQRIEKNMASAVDGPMKRSFGGLNGEKSAETISTRRIFHSNLTHSGTSLFLGRNDEETDETSLTEEISDSEEEQGSEDDDTRKSDHSSLVSLSDDFDDDVLPSTSTAERNSEPIKKTTRKVTTKARRPTEANDADAEGPFECTKCGRSFKLKQLLNQHLIGDCVEPRYSCALCDRKIKRRSNLKGHLLRVHKVEYSQLATYGAVPNVRPELPFKCVRCNRSYKTSGSLGRHMTYECEVIPAFPCTQCEYRATRKDSLRRHLVAVHNVDHSQLGNVEAAALDGRPVLPFKCELCGQSFKTKDDLIEHFNNACDVDSD